jgi:hypothetical protein
MSNPNICLQVVFRRISEALDCLTDEDLQRLGDPGYSIEIKAVRRRINAGSQSDITSIDTVATIQTLTNFENRQEAQSFLELHFPTKRSLEVIARSIDIPIVRQDKVETLRDKIVESTVGARIRSKAIQGSQA